MPDSYNGVPVPRDSARITYKDGRIQVPSNPIIPFIEGDGTGRDIWKASVRVFDAAVQKAYGGKSRVASIWAESSNAALAAMGYITNAKISAARRMPHLPFIKSPRNAL